MTNRESNKEAEPVAWTDQTELDALREHGHGLINAKKDGPFSIPLFTSPQRETEGREITEEMIERARQAWPKTWEPYDLGVALRKALTAALQSVQERT